MTPPMSNRTFAWRTGYLESVIERVIEAETHHGTAYAMRELQRSFGVYNTQLTDPPESWGADPTMTP